MPQSAGPRPTIGIIVPVYRHSGLVAEALTSILRQAGAPPHVTAVINDGCPYRETDLVCSAFAHAKTDGGSPIHYVRRRNGGLSAARNTGIAFLLRRYASLEAVYFLDADNRLQDYALARMAGALAAHPEADWFYPDLEMFGLAGVAQYHGTYSGLIHTMANISEAGSLVRRPVFETGLRFDETMRQGYEDWDFWLGARSAGFEGLHLKHMGLAYRKRPESMLADSHRDDAEIRSYIRRKHKATFGLKNLLTLEAAESPRYAILLDGSAVVLAVDPRVPTEIISIQEHDRRFWRWYLRPHVHFTPPFMVALSQKTFDVLRDTGVLNWVFWDLEARLHDCTFSAIEIAEFDASGAEIERDVRREGTGPAHVLMVDISTVGRVCSDGSLGWWNNIFTGGGGMTTGARVVRVNDDRTERLNDGTAFLRLHQRVAELHASEFRQASETSFNWAGGAMPPRHNAFQALRAVVNHGVVLPMKPDERKHVAILLSFADFGGVEKVAFNTAKELRAAGFVPHLVLFRTGEIRVPPRMRDVFESLLWVTSENLLRWDGSEFNGARLSWWSQHGDRTDVVGLLAPFDAVLNCQSADAHGVMGELKRRGVLTLAHPHIVEHSRAGRPGGSAVLAKAFEHSYTAILTGSHLLKKWFIANGVPQEKLFSVENAPSYELAPEILDEIARERAERSFIDEPLRIVFAARFDVQKGLDRVVDLVKATRALRLRVTWRVIGRAIVDADEHLEELSTLLEVEPPTYTEEALTDIYRWADILVLPSRYEGVPLTVIEAMRCGSVVLAADAGAVVEVIRTGVDGFVVPQATCVEEMLALLRELSEDEERWRLVSRAALAAGRRRSWKTSLEEVVAFLHERLSGPDQAASIAS